MSVKYDLYRRSFLKAQAPSRKLKSTNKLRFPIASGYNSKQLKQRWILTKAAYKSIATTAQGQAIDHHRPDLCYVIAVRARRSHPHYALRLMP